MTKPTEPASEGMVDDDDRMVRYSDVEHDLGYMQTNWTLCAMRADELEKENKKLRAELKKLRALSSEPADIQAITDTFMNELAAVRSQAIEEAARVCDQEENDCAGLCAAAIRAMKRVH